MKRCKSQTLISVLVMAFTITLAVPYGHADLLVTSFFTKSVLRYDETTGAFLGVFASGVPSSTPSSPQAAGDC
jgi:hypothetical protein